MALYSNYKIRKSSSSAAYPHVMILGVRDALDLADTLQPGEVARANIISAVPLSVVSIHNESLRCGRMPFFSLIAFLLLFRGCSALLG